MTERPALFSPFSLRGVTFPNRVVLAPMCQYQAEDGRPTDWHVAHHGRYASSGLGGAIAEATGVSPEGRISPGCTGIWRDDHVAAWQRVTRLYRAQGIPSFLQINHAGPKAATMRPWDGGGPLVEGSDEPPWQTVAPSAVPARDGWRVPRALEVDEMPGIAAAFAEGARRALAAGFDGVEIHGAHGYLLHSFMSPWSNRRSDAYGGDLAGRMRLPLEVARAVREAVPAGTPVLYRASCVDGEGGSLTLDDSVALARELRALGVDLMDCSGGGIPSGQRLAAQKPEPGFQVPYAERIRHETGLPTIAVGMITDPIHANSVIAEGRADLVSMARQFLREPMWLLRAAQELGLEHPSAVMPQLYAFYLRISA
ncbi:NADH:flavin oxidoreductase/NADH oxidase [Jannaschia seohaensis]|uniref:2,4-dienoyl-CoA reductase n=1 Tax=Jannaschia seohaensis TaxID=475081 RepID=A0A2Y9B6U6_9RHOB|nr:NADH:flavin oxidoreductase/NADH oxidase [Jannaschia seohaensis]PWJ10056.1 2,4-dienoyl-CoA reductase-like NADH-dependent reductase (Old Yellow Enzyme family) [Jannaschia seohaensis]SSA51815.1 2,4-dienoyl-CoA reductase [Jannaschia seohaensis]